jgi:hypothetical protein
MNETRIPTQRQGTVLATLDAALGTGRMSARQVGLTRSDVCWRTEEAGWVTGSMFKQRTPDELWRITEADRAALERWRHARAGAT